MKCTDEYCVKKVCDCTRFAPAALHNLVYGLLAFAVSFGLVWILSYIL